jgi:hypothetical protein
MSKAAPVTSLLYNISKLTSISSPGYHHEATVVDYMPHAERRRSSVWSQSGTQSLSSSPDSKMAKVIEGVKGFFSSGSKEESASGAAKSP